MAFQVIGYTNAQDESMNFEVRTDGNMLNSGGFATQRSPYSTGTDRTQSASPHVETTGGVTAATKIGSVHADRYKIVLANYTVAATDVGNTVRVSASTNATHAYVGMYLIVAADTTNNAWQMSQPTRSSSIDSSPATLTLRMGGALPSLGAVTDYCNASEGDEARVYSPTTVSQIWIKSGTYTMTSTDWNTNHGPVKFNDSNMGPSIHGYETTRGDMGEKPVIDVASSGHTSEVLKVDGYYPQILICNLEIHMAGASVGISMGGYQKQLALKCKVTEVGSGSIGFKSGSSYACESIGTTGGDGQQDGDGFQSGNTMYCVASNCYIGFEEQTPTIHHCLAYDCTQGFHSDHYNTNNGSLIFCVADDCATGFYIQYRSVTKCVATNCTTGFESTANSNQNGLNWCFGWNNTAHTDDFMMQLDWTTLGADPWENQSGRDYRLNSAETGGDLLRSNGFPPPGQTADVDINAFITTKSGGGGGGTTVPQGLHSIESGINA